MALPEDLEDDFADPLVRDVQAAGLNASVVVEPGSEDRDVIAAVVLLVVHFAHAQGLNLALGTASGALWDGVKTTYNRVRGRAETHGAPVKVVAQYRNGPLIEIDLQDESKLPDVLAQLRASAEAEHPG
jgi:hypothetical protein